MSQRDLLAELSRWEIAASTTSWHEDGVVCRVTVGAHCIDLNWPWFEPWQPWNVLTPTTEALA